MPFKNRLLKLLIVGSAAGPGLVIDSTVPAILQTFYTSAGLTLIQVSFRAINAAGNYWYQVVGAASDGRVFEAEGVVYVATSTVVELQRVGAANATTPHTTLSLLNRAGVVGQVTAGEGGGLGWSTTATSYWVFNFPVVGFFKGVDIVYDQVSQPRGAVLFEPITSVIASDGTANEQLLYTTVNSYTFVNGRAYEVELIGRMHAVTATNRVAFNIRKTNLAGTKLLGSSTINIDVISTEIPVFVKGVFVNTSGADVTAKLAVTWDPVSANVIDFDGAAAPVPSYLRVTDIGDTGMYSGVSV